MPPEIEGPPVSNPYVINAAETATAKSGITLKMAKARIDMRKAAGLPHRIIWMVPALRPEVDDPPDAATMAAFFTGKATPRQRERVRKHMEREARAKEGNQPVSVQRLGQQALKRAQEIGIDAAVFLGMGAGNCKHTDAVDLAKFAGTDPAQTVCGNKDEGCPSIGWCMADGYKRGIMRAAEADMVVVATTFLTEWLPAAISARARGVR